MLWWKLTEAHCWSSFMKLFLWIFAAPTFCSEEELLYLPLLAFLSFTHSSSLPFYYYPQVWCFPPMETFMWLLSVMTSCTLSTTHGPTSGLSLTHRRTDITPGDTNTPVPFYISHVWQAGCETFSPDSYKTKWIWVFLYQSKSIKKAGKSQKLKRYGTYSRVQTREKQVTLRA